MNTIILVLVLQDPMIFVIALQTLTILEVNLQNMIGVAFEPNSTTVAVSTLWNMDIPNIATPTHLANGITLCLQNVDLLMIAAVVMMLLLELNSLAMSVSTGRSPTPVP